MKVLQNFQRKVQKNTFYKLASKQCNNDICTYKSSYLFY